MCKLKTTLSIIITLLIALNLNAQNNNRSIKPLRIGIKVGVPNILTANAEYVTPLLNNRLAISVDYMDLAKTIDDTDIAYNNFEIGTNFYFNSTGKGIYAGVSYFSFDGEGTFSEVEFDNGFIEDGKGNIEFNTINVKLGAKLGRIIYFRIEVGYGFGDIPEDIEVTSITGTQITTEEIPEIPGITTSGIPNVNFGIGFSLF